MLTRSLTVVLVLQVIVVGGFCEILGWVGRLWSNENVYLLTPFLLQQILLILAPCFFSAALYASVGQLIRVVGPQFSVLRSVAASPSLSHPTPPSSSCRVKR